MAAVSLNVIIRTACYVTRYVTCLQITLLKWAKWAWVCRGECRWNAKCCTDEREVEFHDMLIARFPNISAYLSQNVSPSMYIRTVTLARVTVAVVFNKTQQLILSFQLEWQSRSLLFKNSVRNAYFSRLLPIYKNTRIHIHTYERKCAHSGIHQYIFQTWRSWIRASSYNYESNQPNATI